MKIKCITVTIICFFYFSTVCSGEISGYVKDYRGNPVSSATITLTDESNPSNVYSAKTDTDGGYEITGLESIINENELSELQTFELFQNYPNPFNPSTIIPFYLNKSGFVELTIYNILGQKVKTLIHDFYHSTGFHTVIWNGLDDSSMSVGSGIYIYQLRCNNQTATKKMLLMDSGGYSMAVNPSHLMSYGNTAGKPAFEAAISEDTTYHITITGEEIKPFEKRGLRLKETAPSVDFIVASAGSDFHLSIVHTNDSHSRILPEIVDGNTQVRCAQIATMSKWQRNRRQNVLMLDAGDQFERTDFNTIVHEANNLIVNLLNYDCMTIGNWDLSYGPSLLADYINGLNCPVVSCNINIENEPMLKGLFDPYTIIEVGDYKVGIVGLATTDRWMYFGNVENIIFEDIIISAQNAVDELKNQGVNIIIALNHIGYYDDAELAANVDGIDIVVGGHSHTLLSNTDENAQGPYPTPLQSPSMEPVLIVQAGCFNNYIGCLDVIFNENGVAIYWTGDTYYMDNSIPEDEAVSSVVNDMIEELAENGFE